MNIIKCLGRANLRNNTHSNCREIKTNGPTLEDFVPDAAVIHWLNNGRRHVNGHKLPTPLKKMSYKLFKI